MTPDAREDVEDLLLLWWLSERRASLAPMGLPRECPSTKGYRSGARWGNDDDDGRSVIVAAVAAAVAALHPVLSSAAQVHARNLACGVSVWRSARATEEDLDAALEALHLQLGLQTTH